MTPKNLKIYNYTLLKWLAPIYTFTFLTFRSILKGQPYYQSVLQPLPGNLKKCVNRFSENLTTQITKQIQIFFFRKFYKLMIIKYVEKIWSEKSFYHILPFPLFLDKILVLTMYISWVSMWQGFCQAQLQLQLQLQLGWKL